MIFIETHNRAFKAEALKLKRSGMFWLIMGAALFIPLIMTIVYLAVNMGEGATADTSPYNGFIESCFGGFTSFFFPLFLVLMVVRIVYLEHRSDTWKLMETQPVSKLSLYLAKWEVAAIISLVCLIALLLFSLAGGLVVQIFKPKYNFDKNSIKWTLIASAMLRLWIASLGIISIQYFAGLLIKSFAWPMTIGLIAVIAGSVFTGFDVMTWWPYSAPSITASAFKGSAAGNFLLTHEKMSLLWAMFFLWLGYQLFIRKSFKRAVFFPAKSAWVFVGLLVLFLALASWLSRPDTLKPYGKTVLAGTLISDKPIQNVVLLQAPAFDTVSIMPVKNGKFWGEITMPLDAGMYFLRAGSYRSQIFFGPNDSVHITLSLDSKRNEEKISGTRIAENEYIRRHRQEDFSFLRNQAYTFTPGDYQRVVLSMWSDEQEKIEKFKTVDNIKPREDFIDAQKSMVAIRLLNLVENHYPKVFAVYHPNEKLKFKSDFKSIRKAAGTNNNALAMYSDYRSFINESIRNKSGRNDSLYLSTLQATVNDQKTRDYILYDAAKQDFLQIRDSAKRKQIFAIAMNMISDPKLKTDLNQKLLRMQLLQRGNKAPNFTAEALNQPDFDLSSLRNRYVVLDVWATWCGPCKVQAPYFEEMAVRYTNEQIAFVSVSIDENKNAWRTELADKKGRVLQLWAKNSEEDFGNRFAIASIPRFLLIDHRGNIINADLPSPSEPEFEAILQKEIPFLNNRSF